MESLQRLHLKGFVGGGNTLRSDLREIDELDNIKEIIGTQVLWYTEPMKCREFQAWGSTEKRAVMQKPVKGQCQRGNLCCR